MYQNKLSQYLERFPNAQTKPKYVSAPQPAASAWTGTRTNASRAQPTAKAEVPPSLAQYDQNFPNAPEQRRNRGLNAQQGPVTQTLPAAAPVGSSDFDTLTGKFSKLNSLINFQNVIQDLDIYINMLKQAKYNDDLFQFSEILPTINLKP